MFLTGIVFDEDVFWSHFLDASPRLVQFHGVDKMGEVWLIFGTLFRARGDRWNDWGIVTAGATNGSGVLTWRRFVNDAYALDSAVDAAVEGAEVVGRKL